MEEIPDAVPAVEEIPTVGSVQIVMQSGKASILGKRQFLAPTKITHETFMHDLT